MSDNQAGILDGVYGHSEDAQTVYLVCILMCGAVVHIYGKICLSLFMSTSILCAHLSFVPT